MREEDAEDLTDAERRLLADWIVGGRSDADPRIAALVQRRPALRRLADELRGVAERLDLNSAQFRAELSAAVNRRASLADLDHIGSIVAMVWQERLRSRDLP